MRIREFIDKYCMDIVKEAEQRKSLMDTDDLSYDNIIEEPDGSLIKIVYAGEEEIPVLDIITLDKKDFLKIHPSFAASRTYDQYIESIVILEGEEALEHMRNQMLREQERIANYRALVNA